MEGAVYLLCTATALACSLLLFRGFRRTGARLLLWCGLFFAALALENAILFVDLVMLPDVDLSVGRTAVALAGAMVLLYGLVWEVR